MNTNFDLFNSDVLERFNTRPSDSYINPLQCEVTTEPERLSHMDVSIGDISNSDYASFFDDQSHDYSWHNITRRESVDLIYDDDFIDKVVSQYIERRLQNNSETSESIIMEEIATRIFNKESAKHFSSLLNKSHPNLPKI